MLVVVKMFLYHKSEKWDCFTTLSYSLCRYRGFEMFRAMRRADEGPRAEKDALAWSPHSSWYLRGIGTWSWHEGCSFPTPYYSTVVSRCCLGGLKMGRLMLLWCSLSFPHSLKVTASAPTTAHAFRSEERKIKGILTLSCTNRSFSRAKSSRFSLSCITLRQSLSKWWWLSQWQHSVYMVLSKQMMQKKSVSLY